MTGFGASTGLVDGIEFSVEVRSVNNRYLKLSLRLPDSLLPLETKIDQLLRKHLQRGSVSLSVRMKLPQGQGAYRVDTVALGQYLDQLKPLEVEANPLLRLDLASLLQLPGVCQPPAVEELLQRVTEGVLNLVIRAIDALAEMRLTEGRAIVQDLLGNVAIIEKHLAGIADQAKQVVQLYHDRLAERVAELTARAKLHLDEDTLAREVAIYAERSDIAEELSRLSTHLKEFRKICDAAEPMGRKLDFMAQEMLREANTIASKGGDAGIARAVVDIKTAIDRIKEQAANLE
jgi:uncharacterized protein (TIGR00255 family)